MPDNNPHVDYALFYYYPPPPSGWKLPLHFQMGERLGMETKEVIFKSSKNTALVVTMKGHDHTNWIIKGIPWDLRWIQPISVVGQGWFCLKSYHVLFCYNKTELSCIINTMYGWRKRVFKNERSRIVRWRGGNPRSRDSGNPFKFGGSVIWIHSSRGREIHWCLLAKFPYLTWKSWKRWTPWLPSQGKTVLSPDFLLKLPLFFLALDSPVHCCSLWLGN